MLLMCLASRRSRGGGKRAGAGILALSSAHFLLSTAAAFLTYGPDLDQLRSRSAVSRVAGVVHDVLWYPHDALLRALPPGSITRPGVVPAVLVGSSLAWGIVLWGLWHAGRRRGTPPEIRAGDSGTSEP